jgi:hypothetical protein
MKTDNSRIRTLIRQYMDGLTTNEEEKLLADFFANGEVPDDLMPYRDMFDLIATPTNSPSTEEVDNYFADNGITKEEMKHHAHRIVPLIWSAIGIAASVALIFFMGYKWHGMETEHNAPVMSQTNERVKEVVRMVNVDRVVHDTIHVVKVVTKSVPDEKLLVAENQVDKKTVDHQHSGTDKAMSNGVREVINLMENMNQTHDVTSNETSDRNDETINIFPY